MIVHNRRQIEFPETQSGTIFCSNFHLLSRNFQGFEANRTNEVTLVFLFFFWPEENYDSKKFFVVDLPLNSFRFARAWCIAIVVYANYAVLNSDFKWFVLQFFWDERERKLGWGGTRKSDTSIMSCRYSDSRCRFTFFLRCSLTKRTKLLVNIMWKRI